MSGSTGESALILMAGDVLVDRADPEGAFSQIRGVLAASDVLFGNCEAVYSATSAIPPHVGAAIVADPSNVAGLASAGFTVMSCANNHIGDGGHIAMFETADHLRSAGITPVGIGANLAAARAPAFFEANGVRIAVLAAASVFPYGYEARDDWPGLAPLRGYNLYEDADPYNWVPGAQPRVRTFTDEQDLAALETSIVEAHREADIVVASFHWGDWTRPAHLTDHEIRVAHRAVDVGADIVVGHHHHLIRGIEWYRGRPIFYGLGHLIFDLERTAGRLPAGMIAELPAGEPDNYYGIAARPGWPQLPLHPDSRMTMVVWADVTADGVHAIGVVPCIINPQGQAVPVSATSADGQRVLRYLAWTCADQGLQVSIEPAGNRPADGISGAIITPG
jgi:poly-gamma-glutamate capsule biosynthesis protein CapA/YwtB (metallophosphatase superfamily)